MSTTKTISMTLAKATPEDFRIMWKVSKAHQNLAWAHNRQRELRLKMLIIGRLEQLGSGGFIRIVMGCESLIAECCDPKVDHLALKPVYGAAPELVASAMRLESRGFFVPVTCADDGTLSDMKRMREALMAAAVTP